MSEKEIIEELDKSMAQMEAEIEEMKEFAEKVEAIPDGEDPSSVPMPDCLKSDEVDTESEEASDSADGSTVEEKGQSKDVLDELQEDVEDLLDGVVEIVDGFDEVVETVLEELS